MDTESSASPEPQHPSIERESGTPLMVGSFSIDSAIQMHLVDCQQCRDFTMCGRPVPNIRMPGGTKDGHCGTYWQLQLMRARYEGAVNNIVAHTEYGDEAATGKPLDPHQGMT